MSAWRIADSLQVLRAEINERWPNRDRTSDGSIGDAAHAARNSDHNPWVVDENGIGVVRALDIDADGIDVAWYAEHLRQLGKAGDQRVRYVIFNRRIASSRDGWAWRPYTGANAHKAHVHLSVSTEQAHYDSVAPWGVLDQGEGFLSDLSASEQQEVLTAARTINSLFGIKGKGLRQAILEIQERTKDLVTGKRPG